MAISSPCLASADNCRVSACPEQPSVPCRGQCWPDWVGKSSALSRRQLLLWHQLFPARSLLLPKAWTPAAHRSEKRECPDLRRGTQGPLLCGPLKAAFQVRSGDHSLLRPSCSCSPLIPLHSPARNPVAKIHTTSFSERREGASFWSMTKHRSTFNHASSQSCESGQVPPAHL